MFYRKYVTWKRLKIVAIILGQLSHTKFANLVSVDSTCLQLENLAWVKLSIEKYKMNE